MKRLNLLLGVFLGIALSGCYSVQFTSIENNSVAPTIDINKLVHDSPPEFIDRTLDHLTLPYGLLSRLTYNDKVMISPMGTGYRSQSSARFVVDRALVENLLAKNIAVVERNRRILGEVLAESGSNENDLWRYYIRPTNDSALTWEAPSAIVYPTKILAYRILDLGITQSLNQADLQVHRFGIAQLELRLIDVPTSRVLYSATVTSINQDTISNSEFLSLSRLHLIYYPYQGAVSVAPSSSTLQESALSGEGFALGTVQFSFVEGPQTAQAYISDASTNRLIKTIEIPGNDPGAGFTYIWNLKDNQGNPVKTGNYVLWLGSQRVSQFELGN